MTRPSKTGKRPRAKPPARKPKESPGAAILEMLGSLDPELVEALKRTIADEAGFGPDVFAAADDPVEMFRGYLEDCKQASSDEDEKNDLLSNLVDALTELRIDANGGRRDAREGIRAVYDLLDAAIEERSIPTVDLMIIAKVFADAGMAVPDTLKQAVAEALEAGGPNGAEGGPGGDLVASLLEDPALAEKNPFDVFDTLSSLTVGLPAQPVAMLLSELVAGGDAIIDQAVAGFLLHPDALVAQAVAAALAASAARTPVASAMVERLVRLRPWLPPARQAHIDEAIRVMRANAAPPVQEDRPKLIKAYITVCDGSGTRSLFVSQRVGVRYQIVSVMMKRDGVADAMVLPELAKSAMDRIIRQMKSSAPAAVADMAGVARMLSLAIADNFAAGALPPYKLVEVVENLGLGPIYPDPATPGDLIAEVLAGLPPEQTGPEAVEKAHIGIVKSEFEGQWFEAGEALEDLLYPVKGFKQRVAAVLRSYLAERRGFWARQCALSALALRGDPKTKPGLWKQLALVGRDIDSDAPLDRIPLMRQVAEGSVMAFESQI